MTAAVSWRPLPPAPTMSHLGAVVLEVSPPTSTMSNVPLLEMTTSVPDVDTWCLKHNRWANSEREVRPRAVIIVPGIVTPVISTAVVRPVHRGVVRWLVIHRLLVHRRHIPIQISLRGCEWRRVLRHIVRLGDNVGCCYDNNVCRLRVSENLRGEKKDTDKEQFFHNYFFLDALREGFGLLHFYCLNGSK